MARPWSQNELKVLNSYLQAGFDLSKSVVLHIPYPTLPLNEDTMISVIAKEMPSHKLTGIDRPGCPTIWILHFADKIQDRSKLQSGLIHVHDDHQLVIRDFDVAKVIQVNLHQISSLTSDEIITKFFSRYGTVKSITNNRTKTGLLSSSRRIFIEIKDDFDIESIPDFITLNNQNGFCVTIGREPLCLRCKQRGHISRTCKAEKCGKCGKYTHTTDNCNRGTFADRVKGPRIPAPEDIQDPIAMEELNSLYEKKLPIIQADQVSREDPPKTVIAPATSTPVKIVSPPPVPARINSSIKIVEQNSFNKTMLGDTLDYESGEISTDISATNSPRRKKVLIDSSTSNNKETHTLVRTLSKQLPSPVQFTRKN